MKSLEFVKEKIKTDTALNEIKDALNNSEAFLVGGFIRDLFLGVESFDRDIVVLKDARKIAQNIAKSLEGTFIELDIENEIYRVVLKDKKTYFDISTALENDILKDVKRRDFTLNSIMYDFQNNDFYDPSNGIASLRAEILKCADIKNLEDDPLRMLRAFRFAAAYNFKIDKSIFDFIKDNNRLIRNIAPERINQELIKLFGGEFCAQSLILADEAGLLREIFPFVEEIKKIPPNSHHHLDLFRHSIETMRTIRLNNPILKLAAFCHDIGKPKTHTIEPNGRHRFIGHDEVGSKLIVPILEGLKFSKKQIEYVSLMIKNHIYPSALMSAQNVQDKAKIRFIKKLDPYVEDIIELARADRLCARGIAVNDEMVRKNLENLDELLNFYKKIKPKMESLPKLLDGKEIMELLRIKPSPILGKIIEALNEAQLEGMIKTKEEAKNFAVAWFKENYEEM